MLLCQQPGLAPIANMRGHQFPGKKTVFLDGQAEDIPFAHNGNTISCLQVVSKEERDVSYFCVGSRAIDNLATSTRP